MAAKNIPKSRRRSVLIAVRVSPRELERIEAREAREGRTRSEILRGALVPDEADQESA